MDGTWIANATFATGYITEAIRAMLIERIDTSIAQAKDAVYKDCCDHFMRLMNDVPLDGQYEHLVFCSGSRKVPFGTKGVSCSCANSPAIKRILAQARTEGAANAVSSCDALIQAAVEKAKAEEREACAKVAEDHVRAHDEMYPEDAIAAAIRARRP